MLSYEINTETGSTLDYYNTRNTNNSESRHTVTTSSRFDTVSVDEYAQTLPEAVPAIAPSAKESVWDDFTLWSEESAENDFDFVNNETLDYYGEELSEHLLDPF